MKKKQESGPKLWNKNFTIITAGTVVSRLGSALSGFALGLLVLDYTKSTFLYALYLVLYNLPQIIMPTLAGPFIDKYSRKKTIYTLDFISAVIYGIFALIIGSGNMNYVVLVVGCVLLGGISSIYMVAYESFYPMLIEEGNYTKAYSIASTLDSLSMVMVPVSAFLYNLVGIGPLFVADMISFVIAAILETQISVEETYVKKEDEIFGLQQYKRDFKEGVEYLRQEKGLLTITIYFVITMFANGALQVIGLPYFRENYVKGEYIYIFVSAWTIIGRVAGGIIHYHFKYPVEKKFMIALIVYTSLCLLDGGYLFMPVAIMSGMCFLSGIMGVTSYNIRISATQSYIPDERKGRFNGIFQMLVMIGMMSGEFLSGILADHMGKREVCALFMSINFIAVWAVMYRNRKHVKLIYNRQA